MKADFKILYKNSWFNMIWLMVTAILSAAFPAWGLSLAVTYFVGWILFAAKEKGE